MASVSHLALTVSSSLSFYIYFALYGAKHEVGVVQTIKCKWQNIWRTEREVNMVSINNTINVIGILNHVSSFRACTKIQFLAHNDSGARL